MIKISDLVFGKLEIAWTVVCKTKTFDSILKLFEINFWG